jgi:hypothetical protein
MIAAFFFVAAYIGFADVGSRLLDPPPKPARALSAPEDRASVAIASSGDESAGGKAAGER